MRTPFSLVVVAFATTSYSMQQKTLGLLQANNHYSFAQVRQEAADAEAAGEQAGEGNFDSESLGEGEGSGDGEDSKPVEVGEAPDLDKPADAADDGEADSTEPASNDDEDDDGEEPVVETFVPVNEDMDDEISDEVQAVVPYDMTPTDLDDVKIEVMEEKDDETPDQDAPNAPEGDVHPEMNNDAGQDADEDNQDSIIIDSADVEAKRKAEIDQEEETEFSEPELSQDVAATIAPLDIQEPGKAPVTSVVPEGGATPMIIDESEADFETSQEVPEIDLELDDDLETQEAHDVVLLPTPKTMTSAPPAPEEDVEEILEEPEVEDIPIPEEPHREPAPEVYAKAALNSAKAIKTYLSFVELMQQRHEVETLETCVECYYTFQNLNFELEARQIFFLNIARDLEKYLAVPEADREHAENEANEHFYWVSELTTQTLEEYVTFAEKDLADDIVGDQIYQKILDARTALEDEFELMFENNADAVEEQEELDAAYQTEVEEITAANEEKHEGSSETIAEQIEADAEEASQEEMNNQMHALEAREQEEQAEKEAEELNDELAEEGEEGEAQEEDSSAEVSGELDMDEGNPTAYDSEDLKEDAEVAAQVEALFNQESL